MKYGFLLWLILASTVAAADMPLSALPQQSVPSVVLQINGQWYELGGAQVVNTSAQLIIIAGVQPVPVPIPTPGPNPTPNPTPVPVPTPVSSFRAEVASAFKSVKNPIESKIVAGIYSAIAGEAESSAADWNVPRMVSEVKIRAATALSIEAILEYRGFWPELAKAFEKLKLEDTDVKKCVDAFRDVAAVLGG
jgi:hypothetical protein